MWLRIISPQMISEAKHRVSLYLKASVSGILASLISDSAARKGMS